MTGHPPEQPLIELDEIVKTYRMGEVDVPALRSATLEIREGEFLIVEGPSGSGKTTLLSLIGCVLYPTDGCVCVNGVNTRDLNDREMARLRLKEIGFVFQQFHLYPHMTALQNVTLAPTQVRKLNKKEAEKIGRDQLSRVGLDDNFETVPIEYGVRMTGKIGRTDVGLMDIKTHGTADYPDYRFDTVRVSQDFGRSRGNAFHLIPYHSVDLSAAIRKGDV